MNRKLGGWRGSCSLGPGEREGGPAQAVEVESDPGTWEGMPDKIC